MKRIIPNTIKRQIKRNYTSLVDSLVYFRHRNSIDDIKLNYIVFVCKGNICRSAFAEHYLRSLVPENGIRIESCGLDVDQGIHSPAEAIKVGRELGVELAGHQSKGLSACELHKADLIVPMEYDQYLRLTSSFPNCRGRIHLLREFAPWPDRLLCNIYDPFGLGEGEFRRCFKVMRKSLDGLGNRILSSIT